MPGQLAQHLLREEDHRIRLAAALGVPEHPQPPVLLAAAHRLKGVVDAQVLVVAGDDLAQPALGLLVQHKVFGKVQQPVRVAGAAQHGLQRDDALFPLGVDLLPLGKMLPAAADAADPALAAVGEDDQRRCTRTTAGCCLVIRQVVVVGVLDVLVGGLRVR